MRLLNIAKKLEGLSRKDARAACLKLFAPFGIVEDHYATGVNLVMRKPGASQTRQTSRLHLALAESADRSRRQSALPGTSKQHIVLAAHYDTFPGCPGANDNASATAVLYGVAQALWAEKLTHGLTLCIFDEEETDCIGSHAYVEKHGVSDVKAMIDLELVGNGTVVGLWPVLKETPLLRTFKAVLKRRKQPYETGGELPMFWADYLPFRKAGVDSICMSLLPKNEVEQIRPFVTQNRYLVGLKVALCLMKIPPFFKTYHTPHDTADKLSEKSLRLAQDIVVDVVRALQKR